MMKCFFLVTLLAGIGFNRVNAQYYHKDIVNVQWAQAEKNTWQQQNIKSINVHSFEADRTPSEGFYCEKKISKDYREITTYTKAAAANRSIQISYYNAAGLLVKSTDSSEVNATTTLYEYDERSNIRAITSYSHSSDEDFVTALKEVHQYTYNEKNKPVKMLRIKNDTDTLEVLFKIDEKGNVSDEIEKDVNGRHYYYYYDSENRLTDIVKFNVVKRALRPDIVFEYDADGQVEQMTTVEEGLSGNYYTWKYVYNNGLKIIEKCFERNKVLLGYVEYEYE